MKAEVLFKIKSKAFWECEKTVTNDLINNPNYSAIGILTDSIIFSACIIAEAIRNDVMENPVDVKETK